MNAPKLKVELEIRYEPGREEDTLIWDAGMEEILEWLRDGQGEQPALAAPKLDDIVDGNVV